MKQDSVSHFDLRFRRLLRVDSSVLRLAVIAVFLFALMSVLSPDRFFTLRNVTSMSFQFPELGLFALAVTISLVTGGIDLSVVSVANLAGIAAALVLTRTVPSDASPLAAAAWVAVAILLAIVVGGACGFLNGMLVARARITPILGTLGTMQLFMGVALVVTKGEAVSGFPRLFVELGSGTWLSVPVPLLVFAVAAGAVAVLLGRTRLGVHLYLLGGSETAARFAGIPVRSVLLRTYLLSGVLAAVAGLVMAARTNSAKADYGTSYLLQAVLVAVLGGVNPMGGSGRVAGVVLAVLSLQFLSSGFGMLRFSNFAKEFTWGAFLLLIMTINAVLDRRRRHD